MIAMAGEITKCRLEGRMIITVHDELVFDVPETEAAPFGAMVRQIMETAVVLSVPMEVTVKCGPNWAEMTRL
jgi:DNA polymerase-1